MYIRPRWHEPTSEDPTHPQGPTLFCLVVALFN